MVRGFIARADRVVLLSLIAVVALAAVVALLVAAQSVAPALASAGKGFI